MTTSLAQRIAELRAVGDSDIRGAVEAAETLLAENRDEREAYELVFHLRQRKGDFAAAAAAIGEAAERWPEVAGSWARCGAARGMAGDRQGAVDALETAIRIEPTEKRFLSLGIVQHGLGEHETALATLERAHAFGAHSDVGNRAQTWAAKMRVLRDMGRGREADDAAIACRLLYAEKPVWVSSSILRTTNAFPGDHWQWEEVRRKRALAAALDAVPEDEAPRCPPTYQLPDDAMRLEVDAAGGTSGPIFITKANDLFGGQGLRLIGDPGQLDPMQDGVVQHYLDRPFLLDGRKQHLRCYILFTSADPLRAWFWRDGIVRFAPAAYEPGPGWLDRMDMHVTNTALHRGHPGLRFNPDPAVENDGSIWGLAAFLRHIRPDEAERDALWGALEDTARRTLSVLQTTGIVENIAKGRRAHLPKVIGLDILLDETLTPWLIEVQRDPGQTGPGPVNTINGRLFRTVFQMTVAPLATAEESAIAAAEHAVEEHFRGAFTLL